MTHRPIACSDLSHGVTLDERRWPHSVTQSWNAYGSNTGRARGNGIVDDGDGCEKTPTDVFVRRRPSDVHTYIHGQRKLQQFYNFQRRRRLLGFFVPPDRMAWNNESAVQFLFLLTGERHVGKCCRGNSAI